MKKNILFLVLSIFVLALNSMFFLTSDALAAVIDSRDAIIEKKLNCAAEHFKNTNNFNWSDVCYTDTALDPSTDSADKTLSADEPIAPGKLELGTEAYYYKYRESIGVVTKGMKGGVVGAYTYHLSENLPVGEWQGFFNSTNKPNVLRVEGRVSYGEVEYEGTGTVRGIPDWNFETRGLVGYDVPFSKDFRLTPFLGVGYRYLYNKFSVSPATIIDGTPYASGYDRESNYVYLPLGVETEGRFAQLWSVLLKTEFDVFVWGKQISHFENSKDQNGNIIGWDQLENTQKKGFGWRTSARLARKAGSMDLFVEPFIRFWHIKDSDIKLLTLQGDPICDSDGCRAGMEPDNKTWEYGLNLGVNF